MITQMLGDVVERKSYGKYQLEDILGRIKKKQDEKLDTILSKSRYGVYFYSSAKEEMEVSHHSP